MRFDHFGSDVLGNHLAQETRELRFGTSGRRGLLLDLSQLEVYVNALAELEYLLQLPKSKGGIVRGEEYYFAYDLRPSSTQFVAGEPKRGELAQAIVQAIRAAGMNPVNLGAIPTPALACYALSQAKGSIMVTGSHIPFDRNGYKTNTSIGELLKNHELPIQERVKEVRHRVYGQAMSDSPFDENGLFKVGHIDLPPVRADAAETYLARYVDFFGDCALAGMRLLVYQHSAVGRDLLVKILRRLGAEVFASGRSDTFIPIDTENVDSDQLGLIQQLCDEAQAQWGQLDAVVSTDGDSDRPLLVGVDPHTLRARFYGGDLVGMIAAEYLGADAVVVPISCNDSIDRGNLKGVTEPKTRIGSPYVIAGMETARGQGKLAVCGWEANGGFLTGSDIVRNGKILRALPTRDAVLPMVAVLCAAKERRLSLTALFEELPTRFSRAALIKRFSREIGLEIIRRFSPNDEELAEATFSSGPLLICDRGGVKRTANDAQIEELERIRNELKRYFSAVQGFGEIMRLNFVDGVRILFSNGDVAHIRPSGNADELRIYAVADCQDRADAIAAIAVAESDGILRKLERAVT